MIEKKKMGYVDFEYPCYSAEEKMTIFNTETNEVELYKTDESTSDWLQPEKKDHFYPTLEEATEALETFKKELLAKMPEVKYYLEIMRNWYINSAEDEKIPFKENDYLLYCYQEENIKYYRKCYDESEIKNEILTNFILTGFINIGGDTVKVDNIEQIKWGTEKAELCLKGDRTACTYNEQEFYLIERLFGGNFSGRTYSRLNIKQD